jgi:hypothetical protein
MNLFKSALLGACCLIAVAPAQAIVYTGSHAIGTGSISISLTTDGTLGALAKSNITAWSFTMTNGGGTETIHTGNSAFTFLSGGAFQATATDIVFDYAAVGHMQWDNFGLGGNEAYCLATPAASFTCISSPPEEVMLVNGTLTEVDRAGRFVLGTTAAVPEPASWAMMIGGFGLLGAAARRRTTVAFA